MISQLVFLATIFVKLYRPCQLYCFCYKVSVLISCKGKKVLSSKAIPLLSLFHFSKFYSPHKFQDYTDGKILSFPVINGFHLCPLQPFYHAIKTYESVTVLITRLRQSEGQ